MMQSLSTCHYYVWNTKKTRPVNLIYFERYAENNFNVTKNILIISEDSFKTVTEQIF